MARRWIARSRALARRLLPLTMSVVVAIFVASTIYSQLLLTNDVDALDIASNSAPSIAELANARAELRKLGRAADRVLVATDPAAAAQARAEYAQHRRVIDAALAEYSKTPDYRGEHELFVRVPAELARLDAIVRGGQAAPQSVEAAIDAIETSMRDVSELNRRMLEASAQTIARIGRRRNVYAFALDGLGILVAFIATLVAIRTVERYLATLGRRTRELEHLAIQVGHEIANPLTPIQVALRMLDGKDGGDEQQRNALLRANRSLVRIEESIGRLTTFASAGIAPADPLPSAPLAPALEAVARAAGISVMANPDWQVALTEPMLRDLFAELIAGSTTPDGPPLVGVDVRASRSKVRITILRRPDGQGARDPFDPQLHTPTSGHPGIDLRLATVRRRVEACGGTVGARLVGPLHRLWIELPRA